METQIGSQERVLGIFMPGDRNDRFVEPSRIACIKIRECCRCTSLSCGDAETISLPISLTPSLWRECSLGGINRGIHLWTLSMNGGKLLSNLLCDWH
jgi:hypothetical protein